MVCPLDSLTSDAAQTGGHNGIMIIENVISMKAKIPGRMPVLFILISFICCHVVVLGLITGHDTAHEDTDHEGEHDVTR